MTAEQSANRPNVPLHVVSLGLDASLDSGIRTETHSFN